MAEPRPEFAIPVALAGVLLAIGVPALGRGETWLGGACVAAAVVVAVRLAVALWRAR